MEMEISWQGTGFCSELTSGWLACPVLTVMLYSTTLRFIEKIFYMICPLGRFGPFIGAQGVNSLSEDPAYLVTPYKPGGHGHL